MIACQDALIVAVPWWLVLTGIVVLLLILAWQVSRLRKNWEPVSADIQFADLGKITIRPNHRDVQLAHQAWVELATRKAGIPFDPESDVIVEVYDSWYELFGCLRELAKECPAMKVRRDESTRQIVATIAQVLNEGIRPHLTRWQARFRRWYENALETAPAERTPQEIQRGYPEYSILIEDLQAVQDGLRRYMDLLKELATGKSANAIHGS